MSSDLVGEAVPALLPADATVSGSRLSVLRHYRWQLLTVVVLLVGIAILAVRWWRGAEVTGAVVVRRDFVQTVVASGHVETPHRIDVGVQITGTVQRVPVSEGQIVKKGDLLIELESSELQAAARQAEVAVTQQLALLRQLREVQAPVAEQTLRQAQANLANAHSVLQRDQDLAKQGFISDAALDDARRAVELADAQVRSTRKEFETARPAGSDRAFAEASVAVSRATAEGARARARYATVTAAVAGTLISRNVEVGDVVQAGKVLMTLSPTGRTQLVVEIDEKNLGLLKLGQPALASADAYPSQHLPAELIYINPGINAQTGAVEVKLDVPQPPPTLKQDMTVSVDIEVARRNKVLVVPSSAIHDADSAAPWVLRVEGARALRRPVRVGLRSGGLAEVIDGLSEGDIVVASPVTTEAGARVRVAPPSAPI